MEIPMIDFAELYGENKSKTIAALYQAYFLASAVVVKDVDVSKLGLLGQRIANGVGLALSGKHLVARFNNPDSEIVDDYTQ